MHPEHLEAGQGKKGSLCRKGGKGDRDFDDILLSAGKNLQNSGTREGGT